MDLPAAGPIPLPLLVDRSAPLIQTFVQHPADRQINWMRSLGMWQLRQLWRLAERYPQPLDPQEFVRADGGVTICAGKNHLPVFSWFEKRFAQVEGQVVGYNETGWEKTFVGPGHFVLQPGDDEFELIVDYRIRPTATHPDFPSLDAGGFLAGLVYGGLVDKLRRVGGPLLIGRSVSDGFSVQAGAFFALHLPTEG